MKRKKYITIITFVFLISCAPENEPPPGTYFGKFHTQIEGGPIVSTYDATISIQEPTSTSIKINGEVLSKKGYRIKGHMGNTSAVLSTNVILDAKWRKKGGACEIYGTFTAPGQYSQIKGTFEMTN